MAAQTYVPTNRKRWKRQANGTLGRVPDVRLRCSDDNKVVFFSKPEAELTVARAAGRGTQMWAYLGKCGHWHVARVKIR